MSEQEEIRRILVAADGSAQSIRAVRLAAKIAKAMGADLAIVHVNELHELPSLITEGQNTDEGPLGQTILGDALEIAMSEGVKATGVIRNGHAAGQILVYAHEYSPQLIFMGTRGLGRTLSLVLGSVSQIVVHGAKTSVVVVK
jgi:nucleotide-binding universal stress UspA family protein